jgi:hypothetical protein
MTNTRHRHRPDPAHHHPAVRRALGGTWTWQCSCGGASCRSIEVPLTWRQAVISALNHSTTIAP